jgi:hypothetical protein
MVSLGFTALTSALVAQQASLCALLTPADIEAATGGATDAGHPTDMPSGTGTPVRTCMWPVKSQLGGLTLSVGPAPVGNSAVAAAKHNPGVDALRAAHWTEEAKDYPNAWCSIMSSPATDKEPMFLSSCTGQSKGQMVSLAFQSPKKKLTLEEAKALLDKAIARLH